MPPPNGLYPSHPTVNAAINQVDNESPEYLTKALGTALLSYYFPLDDGFLIAPEQSRGDNRPDLLVLKLIRQTGGFRDHAFVECKKSTDPWLASMEQLSNAAADHINASPFDRCFAILILGYEIKFFEYHACEWRGSVPDNHNHLVPLAPPGYDRWKAWNLKDDDHVGIIDGMFRYIAASDMPPER
ncbi:hypothetical protein L228DRAFT_250004 [Xylona heveae TC161]|uniref:Uncharacterized protein n=1 Tax=Xylona heveae (strain CBS 132557 / TC161) TaxID=1328760 RepID=A0A165AE51_XYLHT|nr:hypothetical protein L228DRAFT_250004 [Xylona heveae TC161]KZF20328.1 hypothetical protein L228DRAFT_250004 [Xylona heveae TC161]